MRNKPSFVSNSVTRAEAVQALIANKTLKFSKELDDELESLKVNWWPKDVSEDDFTKSGDDEKKVCQPFVTEMLKRFVTGKVEAISKTQTKAKLRTKSASQSIRNIPDPEAYQHTSVGRKWPDVVFYDSLDKGGPYAIVLQGEVKRCQGRLKKFPDEEVGQLTDGLKRLLDKQPFRSTVIGFLTDGLRFYFLRYTRYIDEREEYEESSIYSRMQGWQVIGFVSLNKC